MKITTKNQLTLRDFAFINDRELGSLAYQHGPYVILVGRETYACTYKGQTFSWGHESIQSAVEACARHEAHPRRRSGPLFV
jgi:hypothetical protein